MRQANKKLNLLSGINRHDIKNQLALLDGFLELLRLEIPEPSYEEYFSRIAAASTNISNLISFTKEYEQIGVQAPRWQDLRAIATDAGRGVVPEGVRLVNDLPADREVFADPLIVKVFFNLIDNASRHGGAITTIRFSAEERNGVGVVVVCEDDGDGIAIDEKGLVFDLGYGKNTGFGLALSREILDITGITISETGEPGRGARFEMVVPDGGYRVLKENRKTGDSGDPHQSL